MNKPVFLAAWMLLTVPAAHAQIYAAASTDGAVTYTDVASSAPAHAVRYGTSTRYAFQPQDLTGTWVAVSADGRATSLVFEAQGRFILQQRDDDSAHRVYLCGQWEAHDENVDLHVQVRKQRSAEGVVERMVGSSSEQARILSAMRDRVILQINGETLAFNRSRGA